MTFDLWPTYQSWWSWAIPKQFDPWLTSADLCMTFNLSNALCFGQGYFLPNLAAIGHSLAIWPLIDPGWPLHDLRPQQCTTLPQWFFQPNLVPIAHSWAIWHLVDPVWPCMTFDPSNALFFGQGFFLRSLVAIEYFQSNLTSEWPLLYFDSPFLKLV